jgi:phosphoribosylglycinamide formyltransferase-1
LTTDDRRPTTEEHLPWRSSVVGRRSSGAPLKLGVLISGRGSNLQAIVDAIGKRQLPATVEVVISNRVEAAGLHWAQHAGLRTSLLTRDDLPGRAQRQEAMRRVLEAAEVELVVLAGFDEVLVDDFVSAFDRRIMNIHPSLLPAFGGSMKAVEAAYTHGVKVSGCTVHFVTREVDCGPIILQRVVAVREVDTVETLAERILAEEHVALPEAIRLFAAGRLRLEGRRVRIL